MDNFRINVVLEYISSQDWMDSSPTQLPLLDNLFFCDIRYSYSFCVFFLFPPVLSILRAKSVRSNVFKKTVSDNSKENIGKE